MSGPALEIEGLRRSYSLALGLRRREVLRGLDLELARGRVLGIVGPNGAGKSTLLRLVAGVDRPTAGRLRVLGGGPDEWSVRRRIGFLPESSPFPAELSARAALGLFGSLVGMPRARIKARAAELLERVGLAEHAGSALRRYSRGMTRRFGLAQAWLHQPELVLLDEPTAGLDAEGFDVLDRLLADASEGGATVVLSSHLISDAHARCSELALLLGGRIAARGAPSELLSRPGHWRVELEGLERGDLDGLRAWVSRHGGRVTELAPGGKTLLDLYREGRAIRCQTPNRPSHRRAAMSSSRRRALRRWSSVSKVP